jgi:uracil-DNA glycosylase
MRWKTLSAEIKKCHRCDGLNDIELGTKNAPGYGNTKSPLMRVGQSLPELIQSPLEGKCSIKGSSLLHC